MKRVKNILKSILLLLALALILMVTFYGHRDIPLEELKLKYSSQASAFISVEGMPVHYRDEGTNTDSIPIVLIHGTGSSLHTFDAWTEALQNEYRVIRMDLPGYGLTGPFPDRDYNMDHYVEFVDRFLKKLGVTQCILGGNSLGGNISWRYTLQHPEKVKKLILINASGYPSQSKERPIAFKLAELPLVKNIFTFITPRFVARSSVENVYADKSKVTDSLVDRYFELTLRAGNRQAFVDRLGVEHSYDHYQNISSIRQPTLILWGEHDDLIPVDSAIKFHNDLPNNTLEILRDVGHVPMEESPKKSLKIVQHFLNQSYHEALY